MLVAELKFADDATLVGDSRESIVRAAELLIELLLEWGLTMSFPNTKLFFSWHNMWGGKSAANTHRRRDHRGGVKFEIPGKHL